MRTHTKSRRGGPRAGRTAGKNRLLARNHSGYATERDTQREGTVNPRRQRRDTDEGQRPCRLWHLAPYPGNRSGRNGPKSTAGTSPSMSSATSWPVMPPRVYPTCWWPVAYRTRGSTNELPINGRASGVVGRKPSQSPEGSRFQPLSGARAGRYAAADRSSRLERDGFGGAVSPPNSTVPATRSTGCELAPSDAIIGVM